MQLSTLICALLASTVLAATSTVRTSSRAPTATAAVRAAVPRVLKPATPPTAADVQNSISNWVVSVNTVNDYLDNPSNQTKLNSAVVFAKDEPVQLATLMKVTGLPVAGKNAGTVLMGNFPRIVSNLDSVHKGVMSTNERRNCSRQLQPMLHCSACDWGALDCSICCYEGYHYACYA
jgi:hypothetical protein